MTGRPFPTKDQIVEFIRSSSDPVGKREIARAFQIKGPDRIELKKVVKELREEGILAGRSTKRLHNADDPLPPVAVLTVGQLDDEGDFTATPENWPHETPAPTIRLAASGRHGGQIASGARVLSRLTPDEEGGYDAKPIRVLPSLQRLQFVGVVRKEPDGQLHVVPVDRRQRGFFPIAETQGRAKPKPDDLVRVAEIPSAGKNRPRRGGDRATQVRIEELLGNADGPGAISLISIHSAGIPTIFPQAALADADKAKPPELGSRTDLRHLPLVTIDGADARDFDDAVYAEKLEDKGATWRLIVAIADVSLYVTEDSTLDREAFNRGNSTYFPDRVVPMLPEALSNGLCSLRPNEDRAVLFVEIMLSDKGDILSHTFGRGLMRSAARLIYEDVQTAIESGESELLEPVLKPLYGVFNALQTARLNRGALDLELTEMYINLAKDGAVAGVSPRERLDSHRLIEECMIAANVCAAQSLGRRGKGCLYRNHDAPGPEKISAARDFLAPFGYKLPKTGVVTTKHFTSLLDQARGKPEQALVNETVLRSQSQAQYAPKNLGHFGLGLSDYAHFTSPIRRYADLIVHRSLIATFKLGEDGLTEEGEAKLGDTGEHVSFTERRSAGAERDAQQRYMASYLANRIGQEAEGRISGVTRFGLFVRLDGTMAEGLVPIARLPADYYDFDPAAQQLVGRRSGQAFTLGEALTIIIREADGITGSSIFDIVDFEANAPRPKAHPRKRVLKGTKKGKRKPPKHRRR